MTTFSSISFSPELQVTDAVAAYWMRQVTLRLRRELGWLRFERGQSMDENSVVLPSLRDRAQVSLDLSRYREEKLRFFEADVTAAWLTEEISVDPPDNDGVRGSFGWVVRELDLDDTACFVLALGLIVVFDHAMGSVIGSCLNDSNRVLPSLALAQKLWDKPDEVLPLADPSHALTRCGLLQYSTGVPSGFVDWDQPFQVPILVAQALFRPQSPQPQILQAMKPETGRVDEPVILVMNALKHPCSGLRVQPIWGSGDAAHKVAQIAGNLNRRIVRLNGSAWNNGAFNPLATLCWLKDWDIFMELESGKNSQNWEVPALDVPITLFVKVHDKNALSNKDKNRVLPTLTVNPSTYEDRCAWWREALGSAACDLDQTIAEIARRFRFEKYEINQIVERLAGLPLEPKHLAAACRAIVQLDIGETARLVQPRFENENLILPPEQDRQFREVEQAMRSLTRVHYQWGAAKAWNEGGISVLFGGPPGTGKTMGAEILASRLDLPMYRIDLSQVVNKYIGETEKNLASLFDAGDRSDIILFFDEADALFGKRTDVKDSRDRYANLEISYLLERMERFKGLAILATNRKKDLDEAFLRRLRVIIDFPLPGAPEREQIWSQAFPPNADTSQIDFRFLAHQFPLSGGHIRSIAFNACLQSACSIHNQSGNRGLLTMEEVIIAVKREYQKLDRSVSRDRFGPWAPIIAELEKNHE